MIRLDTGKRIPDDTPLLWGPRATSASSRDASAQRPCLTLAFALTRKEPRLGDVAYFRPKDARFCRRIAFEHPALPVLAEIPELRRQLFLAKVRAAHAGGGA